MVNNCKLNIENQLIPFQFSTQNLSIKEPSINKIETVNN